MGQDNFKTRRKSFKFLDLVRLILETLRYMPPRIGSALVQIMTCRIFGAKPLPAPMMSIGPSKRTSVKFNQITKLFIRENP